MGVAQASSEIVLSCGAIGSPHLLMLSGVGPAHELEAAGVAAVHDLPGVGKDLQDHINIPIAFGANQKIGIGALTEKEWDESLTAWQGVPRSGLRTSAWVAAGPTSNRTCSFTAP